MTAAPEALLAAPLISAMGLAKHFAVRAGFFTHREVASVRAVDDVSFTIGRGETLGLVGESGCGKSTVGRLLLRLIEPNAGAVAFEGADVFALPPREMLALRQAMQIIFQDPYGSLNP